MANRKVSYPRVAMALVVLIIAIFGIDFIVRSVRQKDNNAENDSQLNVSSASGLETIPSETPLTSAVTINTAETSATDGSDIVTEETGITTDVTTNTTGITAESTEISSVSAPQSNNYVIDPSLYYTTSNYSEYLAIGTLVQASATNPYSADIYSFLTSVAGGKNDKYTLASDDIMLCDGVTGQLNSMISDFYLMNPDVEDTISLISGYTAMQTNDCGEEHKTGYCIDLGVFSEGSTLPLDTVNQTEFSWIDENCYKYGFIKSATVSNHYRYVGIPHSYVMHDQGVSSVEQYSTFLKAYSFDKQHFTTTIFSYDYEIYYVPSEGELTDIPVPVDKYYEISGNNADGYFETIQTAHSTGTSVDDTE